MTGSRPPLGRSAATPIGRRRSPRLTPQAPLIGGFLLLLLLAAGSVALFFANHRFTEDVSHTLEVRGTAYRLLTMIQDAETGERGFLLTGNKDYLRPYESGSIDAPKALADLRRLVADNPAQTVEIARVDAGIKAKLDDLRLTVGLGLEGRRDDALRHVNLNIGNDIMQTIRVAIGAIEAEEVRKENSQTATLEISNRLLAGATLVGVVVVLALAAYSISFSNRATRRILDAQEELSHTNDNLEKLVAERVSELQAANDEIQRFAYIVSHDLRAPLVNVMGFTSELETVRDEIAVFLKDVEKAAPVLVTSDRRMAIETDLPEALGFIRTSTAKMDRLINAILKLSREGRRVLTPEPIDLRGLVQAQGASLSQQLDAKQAELDVQADLPPLVSDRLAVEQIFGNLVENAVKYLSPSRPGRIVVSGRRQGAYVHYDVTDNGRGIEAKDFARVFELFRRSGEQNTQGEGIGLAYVRNLARRLGGNVAVRSKFGKGSTFTVTLPATFSPKARAA